jgi:hypothetical protein
MEKYELPDVVHDFYVEQARKEVENNFQKALLIPECGAGELFDVAITLPGFGTVRASVSRNDANWQIQKMFETLIADYNKPKS